MNRYTTEPTRLIPDYRDIFCKILFNGWSDTIPAMTTVNRKPNIAITFALNLSSNSVAYSPVLDTMSLINSATLFFSSRYCPTLSFKYRL